MLEAVHYAAYTPWKFKAKSCFFDVGDDPMSNFEITMTKGEESHVFHTYEELYWGTPVIEIVVNPFDCDMFFVLYCKNTFEGRHFSLPSDRFFLFKRGSDDRSSFPILTNDDLSIDNFNMFMGLVFLNETDFAILDEFCEVTIIRNGKIKEVLSLSFWCDLGSLRIVDKSSIALIDYDNEEEPVIFDHQENRVYKVKQPYKTKNSAIEYYRTRKILHLLYPLTKDIFNESIFVILQHLDKISEFREESDWTLLLHTTE